MKKFFLLSIVLLLYFFGFSQKIELENRGADALKIQKDDRNGMSFVLNTKNLTFSAENTKAGEYVSFTNANMQKTYNVGLPALPAFSKLIEVPQGATVEINVVSYDEEIVNLNNKGIGAKIMPAQPSLPKSMDPIDAPFYVNEAVYKTNAFYAPEKIAMYEECGQMRATRLGRIQINPFAYNPVKNELKVYTNIKIEIVFKNSDWAKTSNLKNKYASPYFNSSFVFNNLGIDQRGVVQQVPVQMAIVADRMFEAQLAPFIAWKKEKGFDVTVGYTDEIGGSTENIKDFLIGLYNSDNPPSFILLVGDIQQIPEWKISSDNEHTDLYYAEYTGDRFPEVYYGRFSAQTVEQLQPQIDKTIMYEKYEMSDPSYLREVFLVAGDDFAGHQLTHGNGQVHYATTYYFNEENNVNAHAFKQPNDNLALHDSIINNVNNGLSFANYTAHCNATGWADPSFLVGDVKLLTNNERYGLWIGNCCSSLEFHQEECFGEAALRQANGGAIGYIGTSNSSYWDHDYYWGVGATASITAHPTYEGTGSGALDGVWHTQANEVNDITKWVTTQGQIQTYGNMSVEASGVLPKDKLYYWEIYHLMGDPSVVNYIGMPTESEFDITPAVLFIDATTAEIVTTPYALVAFNQSGKRKAVVMADGSGVASVEFSTPLTGEELKIVVTAPNKIPLFKTMVPIAADQPYVTTMSCTPEAVNYGSTVKLDATFKNLAGEAYGASGVVATISSDDNNVHITKNTANLGTINGQQIITVNDAFEFEVANDVPDQHKVRFTIEITGNDAKYSWSSKQDIIVKAPSLEGEFVSVNETNENIQFISEPNEVAILGQEYMYAVMVGGENGYLDANETAKLVFKAKNTGHAPLHNAIGKLTTTSGYVTINQSEVSIETLPVDGSFSAMFDVTTAENVPAITPADFQFVFGDDSYKTTCDATVVIGLVIEGFESGDFSAYNWTNNTDSPWTVTDEYSHNGSKSAEAAVGNNEKATLKIELPNVPQQGELSFWFKTSTEDKYDKFQVKVNGVLIKSFSGENDWAQYTHNFATAGNYTVEFIYKRDGNGGGGQNKVWIDDIVFPVAPSKISRGDITIEAVQIPEWLEFTDNGNGSALLSGTTPMNQQAYSVELQATNGQKTVSQSFSVKAQSDVIYTVDNLVRFYPNPTQDVLNISLKNSIKKGSVEIIDINGRVMLNKKIKDVNTLIDLSGFTKGTYILNLNVDGQLLQNKIILQ